MDGPIAIDRVSGYGIRNPDGSRNQQRNTREPITNHENRKKSTMHHDLHTEIEIDATPGTVWNILTGLDEYQNWNPFIVSAAGTVDVGERLTNRLQPPDGKALTIKPTVTVVDTDTTFEWLGRLGVPGIFDGRHRFELEASPSGGTRLVHSEHFSGVLVRVMRRSLDTTTRNGFVAMNEALKAQAEAASEGTS